MFAYSKKVRIFAPVKQKQWPQRYGLFLNMQTFCRFILKKIIQ